MMTDTPYIRIVSRLKRVRARFVSFGVWEAVCAASAVFFFLAVLAGTAESAAWFSTGVRTVLATLTIALPAVFLAVSVLRVMYRKPDADALARMVEKTFPVLGDRLISAVQLGRLDNDGLRGESAGLVSLLVDRVDRETAAIPIERTVSSKRLVMLGRVAYGSLAVLLLAIAAPGPIAGGISRLADHSRDYVNPGLALIHTLQGDASVVRGDDFRTAGILSGGGDHLVVCWRWKGSDVWNSRPLQVNRKTGAFDLVVEKPRMSFSWYLESGKSRTPRFSVTVIDRPAIERLGVTLAFPRYTGFGTISRDDNDGSIRAVRGTEATLRISANKPLASMTIVWSDSTLTPCTVSGAQGTVTFTVTRDAGYHIALVDTIGISDADPITYRVTCAEDGPPSVSLVDPTGEAVLPRSMRLPLLYRAEDDFGLSRVSLVFRLPEEGVPSTVDVKTGALPRELADRYLWDLSAYNLLPGDRFTVRLAAFDTDTVRGPKKALSDSLVVRMPSMTDIMRESAESRDEGMERLMDARERSLEKDRALEDVRRGMMDGKKPGWSEKNAIDESRKELGAMQKELKDLSESVKESAEKLSAEDMASLETVEKLRTISKMMDDLAEGPLKDAIRKLTQNTANISPKELKDAIENYKVTSEAVKKKLDNLIKLLDMVKTIQRFDTAKRLLEEISMKQADIRDRFAENAGDRRLAREEEALASEMEKLEKELKEMAGDLSKRFSINTKPLEDSLSNNTPSKDMRDASKEMGDGDRTDSRKKLDDANRSVAGLQKEMERLGDAMKGANTREMREKLLSAATELLAVSNAESGLVKDIPGTDPEKLARRQLEIMESFSRAERSMSALGVLSADLAGLIDQLASSIRMTMKNTVDHLASGNVKAGEQEARNALGVMNRTAVFLAGLLSGEGGQGAGKGTPGDLLEQLRMLAENQRSLQMKLDGSQGSEMMRQLAAEQQKLSEMLSNLARRSAEDKRLREMLEKIAGDMDETASQMRRNEPREKVERRQLDIYRRLLDARRSKRERDEETPERKAFTAKQNESKGALVLDPKLGARNTDLNARMQKALEGDFSQEYRDMIRRYFESVIGDERIVGGSEQPSGKKD